MSYQFNSELMARCSNTRGISGFEGAVRRLIQEELGSLEGLEMRDYRSGNLIVRKPCALADAPTLMIAAHMDEIGFMVQAITSDGYLLIVPIGGWWNHTLPSQRVIVETAEGACIAGQIASRPPHLLPAAQRQQVLSDEALCVDVGASSAQQVRALGIQEGDAITPDVQFQPLAIPYRWMGKAFDNRVGVYALINIMKELASCELPCHLIAAATVQEEVGTRGARALAKECIPDLAIILEGPPADDSMGMPRDGRMGELGQGVQVRLFDPTNITPPSLVRWVRHIANESAIPCQWAVRRTGGTDAAASYPNWEGTPSIVLGTPVRYIHSHNGIMDERDLCAMIELGKAMIQQVTNDSINEF